MLATGIGIDIGGTNIRAARVDRYGVIEARLAQATAATPEGVRGQIEQMVAGLDASGCAALGIGIPGRVDAASGEILSGGFVDLSGMALGLHLRRKFPHALLLGNDAGMALVAEARIGAARGKAHVAMLTIGTGIGGALMLNGRIVHGGGTAGQLGHITVDFNGPPCLCGRRGCLETLSSGTAFRRLSAERGLAGVTLEFVCASAEPGPRALLADFARPLRAGLDTIAASFNPEMIVLGGGLGHAAYAALAQFPAVSPWTQYLVAPAALGDDAGVIGAALAALEQV